MSRIIIRDTWTSIHGHFYLRPSGYLFHPCHRVHRSACKPDNDTESNLSSNLRYHRNCCSFLETGSKKKKTKRKKKRKSSSTACLASILNRLPSLSNIIRLIIVSRIPGPVQFAASFIKQASEQASKRCKWAGGRIKRDNRPDKNLINALYISHARYKGRSGSACNRLEKDNDELPWGIYVPLLILFRFSIHLLFSFLGGGRGDEKEEEELEPRLDFFDRVYSDFSIQKFEPDQSGSIILESFEGGWEFFFLFFLNSFWTKLERNCMIWNSDP